MAYSIVAGMGLTDALKRFAVQSSPAPGRRVRASWRGAVLAESDETEVVEGNHYFPAESVDGSYLRDSSTHTTCAWKGQASYYDVVVEGQVNNDAAWYYSHPSPAAARIRDRVAFWHGVKIDLAPENRDR